MKREVSDLFRDAERLRPAPELWRSIAVRSALRPSGADAESGTGTEPPALRESAAGAQSARSGPGSALRIESRFSSNAVRTETPYLRAAAAVIGAGLLALAAFGWLRKPGGGAVGEPLAVSSAGAESGSEVFDPELLGWQADLGVFDSEPVLVE